MGARTTFVAMAMAVAVTSVAQADAPKPKPVDISAYKDQLQIFTDASGGTYALKYDAKGGSELFYGEGTTLYRQIIVGGSADGDAFDVTTYAPRVARSLRASFGREKDGTYSTYCADNDPDERVPVTPLGNDAAKKVIEKYKFLSSATLYVPYGLARDTKGVYYYVDMLSNEYGGKGYRLWVGKKGRMKQIPLADVSDDTGGAVFSTKTGDLHFVVDAPFGEQTDGGLASGASWVRGEKVTELKPLGAFANTWLIHSELGVYKFLGTICDNQRAPSNQTRLPR